MGGWADDLADDLADGWADDFCLWIAYYATDKVKLSTI